MQHIVDDMEAAWESRPYSERANTHRTAAERAFNNRRQQWTRPQDVQPTEGTGSCFTRVRVGVSSLDLRECGQSGCFTSVRVRVSLLGLKEYGQSGCFTSVRVGMSLLGLNECGQSGCFTSVRVGVSLLGLKECGQKG